MSQTINIIVQLTGLFATVSVPAIQLPSNGSGSVTWTEVDGKPSTFPPSEHQHVMDDIQGLINALAGKAASLHQHEMSQIVGLALALADKANVSQLADKADLVNGVIPTSQIPAAAISEFLGDVNSQAAMLALVGQKGDWCIRTDLNRTYFIVGENGSTLANWRFIETPASPVVSVNNQTGVVVLGKSDVGLPNVDNTSDMAKPVSTAQAEALNQKADTNHTHPLEQVQGLTQALEQKAATNHTHAISDVNGLPASLRQVTADKSRFALIEQDFLSIGTSQYNGLIAQAIGAGTQVGVSGNANHPGVVALRDSTTANGGFAIGTNSSMILLAGGERAVFIFQDRNTTTRATAFIRMGFQDSLTSVAPTDGAYIQIQGGVLRGFCRNNTVESITASSFTVVQNTWYAAIIQVISTSLVRFSVLAENGQPLWTAELTTNIPTASGRETGFGTLVWETTTDAPADIEWLDYLLFDVDRSIVR